MFPPVYKPFVLPPTLDGLHNIVQCLIAEAESKIVFCEKSTTPYLSLVQRIVGRGLFCKTDTTYPLGNPLSYCKDKKDEKESLPRQLVIQEHYYSEYGDHKHIVKSASYVTESDGVTIVPKYNIVLRREVTNYPVHKELYYNINGWTIQSKVLEGGSLRHCKIVQKVQNVNYLGNIYDIAEVSYSDIVYDHNAYIERGNMYLRLYKNHKDYIDTSEYSIVESNGNLGEVYKKRTRTFIGDYSPPSVIMHDAEMGEVDLMCHDEHYWLTYSPKIKKYVAGCREFTKEEAIEHWSTVKERSASIQMHCDTYEERLNRAALFLQAIRAHQPKE